jgi:hypothetical protein
MMAAGIKRPTPSNTKPDNKLLKKLKYVRSITSK